MTDLGIVSTIGIEGEAPISDTHYGTTRELVDLTVHSRLVDEVVALGIDDVVRAGPSFGKEITGYYRHPVSTVGYLDLPSAGSNRAPVSTRIAVLHVHECFGQYILIRIGPTVTAVACEVEGDRSTGSDPAIHATVLGLEG